MQLAQVIGTVVASAKSEGTEGLKMLLLQPITPDGEPTGKYVVAFDAVGAGDGEVVLYASGSSGRMTPATQDRPADATIMAIVDTVEVDGKTTYQKYDAGET